MRANALGLQELEKNAAKADAIILQTAHDEVSRAIACTLQLRCPGGLMRADSLFFGFKLDFVLGRSTAVKAYKCGARPSARPSTRPSARPRAAAEHARTKPKRLPAHCRN